MQAVANQLKALDADLSPPRAGALPLHERPVHRVFEAPASCCAFGLIAALIGGLPQIKIAEERGLGFS